MGDFSLKLNWAFKDYFSDNIQVVQGIPTPLAIAFIKHHYMMVQGLGKILLQG